MILVFLRELCVELLPCVPVFLGEVLATGLVAVVAEQRRQGWFDRCGHHALAFGGGMQRGAR